MMYAGLYKMSCDMCGGMGEAPKKTVVHNDGSKVDICYPCYQKCLTFPKFNKGVKDGKIRVVDY